MGCKTIPEQLSEALGKTSVNTSDQLPIVENDTLYRVTVGNLALSLGLTGSITGQNGGSATPILTGTAPNYEIRGVVGGAGCSTSVNANGSVTISTQLSNAGNSASGEPLIPNTAASTIALRRLAAGNGIDLTTESDRIVITNSEVAASNLVTIVSDLSDFPSAVGGVITLNDNEEYTLVNSISTSNRFVVGQNTVISGVDSFITTLTYTGTGTMFTFTDGTSGFKSINLSCPNGTLLDASSVTSGTLLFRFCRFAIKNGGTLGHSNTAINNSFVTSHTGSGFNFGSNVTNGRLNVNSLTFASSTDPTATIIDLGTSTFNALSITNLSFLSTVSGQTFLSGLTAGGNITGSEIGFVSRVTINGDMTGLSTIDSNDEGWDFTDCNKIADTKAFGMNYLSSAQTTAIATVNTPVAFNGNAAVMSQYADLFTMNNNGRATYNGRRSITADVTVALSAEPASGTNKDLAFYVAKNGVVDTNSGIDRTISAGSPAAIALVWAFELEQNDYVEVWCENKTDATDIVFNDVVARVKA